MLIKRLIACVALSLATAPAAAHTLIVSAAASLGNALRDINTQFESTHPGVQIQLNTGASGSLLQQIQQGAPADVFASADQATMDRAQNEHLIQTNSRRDFVANSLVMVVPVTPVSSLQTVADLHHNDVTRIAVGKTATVPAGRYAEQALTASGDWQTLTPKFIPADHVRQVLDYVARAEVDAGFVYRTDAALRADKVRITQTLQGHPPITYPVAILSATRQAPLAQQYLDYLTGEAARKVFDHYGFAQP